MAKLLSSANIFAAPVQTREVEVPEWGGSVLIRPISARIRMMILDAYAKRALEIEEYNDDQAKPEGEREGVEKVGDYDDSILAIIFCIVGEDNQPLFKLSDYDRFLDLPYPTIYYLFSQVKALEQRAPEPAETLKKSSGTTRRGASSSGSRSR